MVRDICDVVYALRIEQLEREVENARLAAALTNAMGGQAEAPTMAEAQREFDEWLLAEPEPATVADEWRQVMGLGAA